MEIIKSFKDVIEPIARDINPFPETMSAIGKVMGVKIRKSTEILINALKEISVDYQSLSEEEKEEFNLIVYNFQMKGIEGTARKNMELLADVISGMIKKKKVKVSTFRKFETILSTLTEDEIVVLGNMVKHENPLSSAEDKKFEKLSKKVGSVNRILLSLLRTGLVNMKSYPIKNGEKKDIKDKDSFLLKDSEGFYVSLEPVYNLTSLMDELLEYTDLIIKDREIK